MHDQYRANVRELLNGRRPGLEALRGVVEGMAALAAFADLAGRPVEAARAREAEAAYRGRLCDLMAG